ncbi:MAG: histidinol-phosphatase [Clostridia bacterium]|nr:histidinol-phosphatase [Clostridia bacterium]
MSEPFINYHTHTWRCQHAQGTEAEYVEAAVRAGYSVLGFSDHTPWPYTSGFVSGMRMRLDQFRDYREGVLALRAQYAERLKLPLGLECEAFPMYMDWLRDFKAENLDYVILGNHYDATDEGDHNTMRPGGGFYFGRTTLPEQVRRYGERVLFGMQTGLFDYVAHPDLFLHTYPAFDADCRAVSRDLCQCARAMGLPLEFNLLGFERRDREQARGWQSYPCDSFWEIAAETGCTAIIGMDAHSPGSLLHTDLIEDARNVLTRMGIRVQTTLPGLGP